MKIAVIGLGYVGLPLAVEFGKKYSVVGYDISPKRINELKNNIDVTLEVDELNLKKAKNLKYSNDENEIKEFDVYIITVPTPVDKVNRPNLEPIIKSSELIGRLIKKKSIVIYESTVYPGCTEEVCVPIIEKISGLKYNEEFYCGYSPERINPGDKINTLINIKKITSGSTIETAEIIDNLYASIINAGTWKAKSIKVAEAAKVIENSQRDLNIAFVNELSVIFNRLEIDTLDVLEAAGSKWNFLPFRPGIVGGHCIGVDPYYLTHKAEEVGYHPQVILAGRRINDNMARYAARNVIRLMIKNQIDVAQSVVGVMGVTFKENCPDIRNSKVIDLINELKTWGCKVVVMDPWANKEEVKKEYQIELGQINETYKVDTIIVAVGHTEFRSMDVVELYKYCRSQKPILGDLKSLYSRDDAVSAGFTVFRL